MRHFTVDRTLYLLLLEKGNPAKAEVSAKAEDFIKRGISLCQEILVKTPNLFNSTHLPSPCLQVEIARRLLRHIGRHS
ncbi:MAG: hypothetical protein HQK89_17360 [Nitrospirae bacterium]|nr:hypothetical protein [Nitrospirota bacterium]